MLNSSILPSSFPVTILCRTIRPRPTPIFLRSRAEKVPFQIPSSQTWLIWKPSQRKKPFFSQKKKPFFQKNKKRTKKLRQWDRHRTALCPNLGDPMESTGICRVQQWLERTFSPLLSSSESTSPAPRQWDGTETPESILVCPSKSTNPKVQRFASEPYTLLSDDSIPRDSSSLGSEEKLLLLLISFFNFQ